MIRPFPKPRGPRVEIKRLPMEEDMTLCIAANVRHHVEESIVCAFDFRIETSSSGSDTGYKFRKLSKDWGAMLAGVTSKADRLLDILSECFTSQEVRQNNALIEIRKAVASYRLELVEEYVQSVVSMSYDSFLERKASFPDHLFEQVASEILRVQQECDIILFCLHQKLPFLYVVGANGLVDQVRNFCAVGSGAPNAEAWLHFREQSSFDQLHKTVVSVYEAKKFAEHAPGVGKTTRLLVLQGDKIMVYQNMSEMDKLWRKYGPHPLPAVGSKKLFPTLTLQESSWETLVT